MSVGEIFITPGVGEAVGKLGVKEGIGGGVAVNGLETCVRPGAGAPGAVMSEISIEQALTVKLKSSAVTARPFFRFMAGPEGG